ncbi:DUF2732 family protein [Brenneria rubrifaciens]|uniref:DUF2732 domain-containing protein n=1 Tax=Brenneria rubrifaciens TaxID=55213 RepID=A0A4P8QX11_9GAMM|nr:DUF2732 family protein [Brenneria rubrifaciens]QCR10039.1 DUF2732 domain-containing protein [Brenneria rubrifaciens]
MKNAEIKQMQIAGSDALVELLKKEKQGERQDQHLAFSLRLAALSIHAQKNEFSAPEIIEILRKESERFENSAQEITL